MIYLKSLHSAIEGKRYDNFSVSAFIFLDGKALIAKRVGNDSFLPGYWEQVGGKADLGETQEQALIREVQEEAGLAIEPIRLYNEYEFMHREKGLMCEYAYVCKVVGDPTVSLSEEHTDYKWITLEELEQIQPMSDYMRGVIQKGFSELRVDK